ncbi:hypothetical protein [Agrobacterium sp. S7/73]|uniref:hypothetical protein n=1 Tax=Agrobacterium sp. S7/73 TaxID=2820002 RepID=UPI001C5BC290|nr:hypothetical protein [Agrobacterium sp. S7/73]QXZ73963.1 hypothetical protein J5276_15240 [Agrobacterium sp. S7/73]
MPRYRWAADVLASAYGLFLDEDKEAGRSYLETLWFHLKEIAKRTPEELDATLQRLFGFGERLAWPKSRLTEAPEYAKRFMTLQPQLSDNRNHPDGLEPDEWFVTNMVSLMGQVFRITPFDPADPPVRLDRAELTIAGNPLPVSAGLATAFNSYFEAIARDAMAATPVSVALAPGPERGAQSDNPGEPSRLTLLAARKAPLVALAADAAPPARFLQAVPEALLDVVDPLARFDDGAAGTLPGRSPPRRGLFAHDLAAPLSAGALLWQRRAAEVANIQVTGAGAALAYALRFPESLHSDEAHIAAYLPAIAAGDTGYNAFLWIPTVDGQQSPQPAVEFRLEVANIAVDASGELLLMDPDPAVDGSLTQVLGRRPQLPGGSKDPKVTVVLSSNGRSEPFDLVEQVSDKHQIVLAVAPLTRLGLSADRLATSLAATWSVPFEAIGPRKDGAPTPLVDQVANTDKLRLTLFGPRNGFKRPLSIPDALLPLPPGSAVGTATVSDRPWDRSGTTHQNGPQNFYWLGEYFDQTKDAGELHEATRFETWVRAGQGFSAGGYFEHQYGYRITVPEFSLDLRRTTDIVNPAQVNFGSFTATDKSQAERLPLIEATEIQRLDIFSLVFGFRADAADAALRNYIAGKPDDLRIVYQALTDLNDAITAGGAEVLIEEWVFDNRAAVGRGNVGTLTDGLHCNQSTYYRISIPASDTPLGKVFASFDKGYADFRAALENAVSAAVDNYWAVLYERSIDDEAKRASLLRVGLDLSRPQAVRATPAWVQSAFIPIALTNPEQGAALADVAKDDLAAYLSNSRLTASLSWSVVAGSVREAAVVGPAAPTLLRPQAPTEPVSGVVDLFYMPHAFMLPAAHPALKDRSATFDFAGFLLALIEDVLAGRPVDDRIDIRASPIDRAIALRRELHMMLAGEGGIAARLMGLFDRVDKAEQDPEPEAEDSRPALHWHAGKLLDQLESLAPASERPRAAIWSMLAERPTLYTSARAVAIVPFNTEVERSGEDPACPFNHDTFSPQILSLTISKLLIGDDGKEIVDQTAFDSGSLRGGLIDKRMFAYLIDVLPDRVYDDAIAIGQNVYSGIDPNDDREWGLRRCINDIAKPSADGASGVAVLRGEDAIDTPSADQPRGIAANVVHVFPAWRVTERGGADTRQRNAYYLLPERRVPPLARSVAPRTLAGLDVSRSPIALNFAGVAPGPGLPMLSPARQWPAAYGEATTILAAVSLPAASPSAGQRLYRRIRAATGSGNPAAAALPAARAEAPAARGWHLLTTGLSNFFFAIDLQKSDATLVEQIDDDLYEFEVEMWRSAPPIEVTAATSPPPETDPLLQAFRRLRAAGSGVNLGATPTISADDLNTSLSNWLLLPPPEGPYLGRSVIARPDQERHASTQQPLRRRFRIARSVIDRAWKIVEAKTGDQKRIGADMGELGSIVGFEVLAQTRVDATDDPAYDEMVLDEHRSALVRVSVLDHPFHVSRVRMRILRNWIDIDGDDEPDINPSFVLTAGYSEWATEGRSAEIIGADVLNEYHVPDAGREIRVVEAGADPINAMEDWLDKIDKADPFDAGVGLPAMLTVPVFLNADEHNDPQSLWEWEWMNDGDLSLSATVNRTAVDLSARYGSDNAVYPIATRDVTSVRQICATVPADQMVSLFSRLLPSEVLALEIWAQIQWRDAEGFLILELQVPFTFKPRL